MPNAARLGDPLEGMQPAGDKDWWHRLAASAKSEDEKRTIEHNHQLVTQFAAAFRTRYYVSCWHMNTDINADMWKRYANDPESVAVRSSFTRLRVELPPYVGIGMVRYIDFAKDRLPSLNMFEYITHKNLCFEHEHELRAVAMHPVVAGFDQQHFRTHYFESEKDASFRVYAPRVNLEKLMDVVVVHRDAPAHFAEAMSELCALARLPAPTWSNV